MEAECILSALEDTYINSSDGQVLTVQKAHASQKKQKFFLCELTY